VNRDCILVVGIDDPEDGDTPGPTASTPCAGLDQAEFEVDGTERCSVTASGADYSAHPL